MLSEYRKQVPLIVLFLFFATGCSSSKPTNTPNEVIVLPSESTLSGSNVVSNEQPESNNAESNNAEVGGMASNNTESNGTESNNTEPEPNNESAADAGLVVTEGEPGTETNSNLVTTIDGGISELETDSNGNLNYVAVLTDGSTVKGMLDSNLQVLSLEDDSALRGINGLRGATRFYERTNRDNPFDKQNCELKVYELPSGQNIWNLPAADNQGSTGTFCSMEAIDNNDNYYYSRASQLQSFDSNGNQRWSTQQGFAPGSALAVTTGEAVVQAGKRNDGIGFRLNAYRLTDGVQTLSGWVFPSLTGSDDATPHQAVFSDNGANLYIGGMGVVNSSCLDSIESGENSDCLISARNTGSQYGGVQISRFQIPTTAASDTGSSGYSFDAVKRFADAEDPGVADAFYSGGYVLMQKGDTVTVLDGTSLSIVKTINVTGTVVAAASGDVYTTVVEAGRTSIYAYAL